MTVITDPRVAGKRERILRAAVEVFARTGYFGAKVAEVAKEAGVADGTIYLYFQGKEDLLITIFREHSRRYLQLLEEELIGVTSPAEKIRRCIHLHLRKLGEDRPLAVVFQVELRQSLKFMAMFSQQEVADYLGHLRRFIEEGKEDGSFRSDLNPQLIAKFVFGIIDEMVTSWILSDKAYNLEEHSAPVSQFVLRGLTA